MFRVSSVRGRGNRSCAYVHSFPCLHMSKCVILPLVLHFGKTQTTIRKEISWTANQEEKSLSGKTGLLLQQCPSASTFLSLLHLKKHTHTQLAHTALNTRRACRPLPLNTKYSRTCASVTSKHIKQFTQTARNYSTTSIFLRCAYKDPQRNCRQKECAKLLLRK